MHIQISRRARLVAASALTLTVAAGAAALPAAGAGSTIDGYRTVTFASEPAPEKCIQAQSGAVGAKLIAVNCADPMTALMTRRFAWSQTGEIRPIVLGQVAPNCVTGPGQPAVMTLQPCTGAGSQLWEHTADLHLRNALGRCIDPVFVIPNGRTLYSWSCGTHELQRWNVYDAD